MDVLAELAWPIAILLVLLVSAGGLYSLSRGERTVATLLTDRFIRGVPWGSIVVIAFVLAIYLFVQDGITHFDRPVFYPYVNWSYLYPLGVVLAPFTHASAGHVVSNLVTAAILGPLAEYIWGHYPPTGAERGRRSWLDIPWVRAVVVFPGAIVVIGVISSLFAWGPVIGFSGVVFAFAGFTVIRYPLGTIVALAARSAVRRLGDALLDPVIVAEVTPTLSPPPWVGVSVQGHAIGFLLGALLAIVLLHARDGSGRPDPVRLWVGIAIATIGLGMWAIWRGRGEDVYVLYQGVGIVLLLGLALLLTFATVASDRRIRGGMTRHQAAILVVAIPILILSLVAIPFNVLTVAHHDPPAQTLSVEGYDVYYADEVEGQLRPALPIPGLADAPGGNASGVIVVSESRHIWAQAISSSRLAFDRETTLALGGVGSRTDVTVTRDGWEPVGNDTVYRISFDDGTGSIHAFASPGLEVEPTVAGYGFTLVADDDGFALDVRDADGVTERHAVPSTGESIEVGALTVERVDDRLFAEHDGTRVRIAEREDPEIELAD